MLLVLEAIKAALIPTGYTTHLYMAEGASDAQSPDVPYLELIPANGIGPFPSEAAVCGPTLGVQQYEVRIRAVSYPAGAPRKILNRVRDTLTPSVLARIPAPGLLIDIHYDGSNVDQQVDRDMTITTSNRHPSWASDSYTVHVQPI